jgi:outer membrane protein TolC
MKRNALIALLVWAGLSAQTGLVAAQKDSAASGQKTSGDQKISDAYIADLIKAAAQRAGVANPTAPAAGSAGAQTAPGSVDLTIDDAIKLALDRNLDIAVQRLNPATYDYAYSTLASLYRPLLSGTISRVSADAPATQTLSGGSQTGGGIETDTNTYNGLLTQNVRKGGGLFLVQVNNNKASTTSTTALYDPAYNTNWAAQYTQPLLRNFKIDANRQQLVVTRLNQDISEIQLQSTIINTISNVKNAYWDLVFAIQSVDVAQRSVALADQLVQDNQTRVEIGTMAPIDVVTAQSQAATQRQNLVVAQGTLQTNILALKRLIVGGTQDPNWSATLNPTDRPEFNPQPIDVNAAVRHAIESRTDLAMAKKDLAVNDITMKYFNNQILPQADLVGRYGLVGQGGTQFTNCTNTGIGRSCASTLEGGYTDAVSTLLKRNYPTWTVQVNVSYPLGTSAAEATAARARIQVNQAAAQIRQIELQIATDVTNAAVNVQNNAERVQAAHVATQLAQQTLDAEQSKFEVGMSTNYFVVGYQRDLATAQNNELQAVLAYRKSLVELERLQQTSLTSLGITIAGH